MDDEHASCETLVGLLELADISCEIIGVATTKKAAIHMGKNLRPDMIFLDIELVEGTGFEVIEELGESCPEIVFTTAHDHYAVDAFRVGASDFLLKPLMIDHLEEALKRVQKKVFITPSENRIVKHELPNRISVRSADRIDYIIPAEISHIEVEGSYCTIYTTKDTRLIATASLKEYEELLGEEVFCRVSHSTLVNLDQIKGYKRPSDKCFVILYNDEQIVVSRRRRNKLLDALEKRFGISSY